jgi:hypothetical protein
MTINRAPFNALIDDDGSGQVGSVWNKAQIQSVLLDPIDTEGNWQPGGTPALAIGGANAGNWNGGTIETWAYSMDGRNVSVTLKTAGGIWYVASNQINVMLPNSLFAQQWHSGSAFVASDAMPYEICAAYIAPFQNWVTIHRNALANFPVSPSGVACFFQMNNIRVLSQ